MAQMFFPLAPVTHGHKHNVLPDVAVSCTKPQYSYKFITFSPKLYCKQAFWIRLQFLLFTLTSRLYKRQIVTVKYVTLFCVQCIEQKKIIITSMILKFCSTYGIQKSTDIYQQILSFISFSKCFHSISL